MRKTLGMVGIVALYLAGCHEAHNGEGASPDVVGAWRVYGDGYRGRVVEIAADRTSRQFAARGEISFALKVSGNTFDGMASATFFDASGHRIRGPVQVKMEGERVLP